MEPKRLTTAARMASRIGVSAETFAKHQRRGLFKPDAIAGRLALYDPERVGELHFLLIQNQRANARHCTPNDNV